MIKGIKNLGINLENNMWYQYKDKIIDLSQIHFIRASENDYSIGKYQIEFVLFPGRNTVVTFYFDTENQRDRTFTDIYDLLKQKT